MDLFISGLRVLSEVLTAAVAMTAFSVLLFSLQFLKKRQRLAAAFFPLLICVTLIYSADALETVVEGRNFRLMWQMVHWTGFILLPAVSLRFAAVLLEMTGKEPGKYTLPVTVVNHLLALAFIVLLWSGKLFNGIRVISNIGTTMVRNGQTVFFWLYFFINIAGIIWTLFHAFSRTRTQASRRRMIYLVVGLLGIILGSFPLLLFGSGLLISQYPVVFWSLSVIGNAVVTVMVLLLGYAVATFSVSWSDRLTRLRMIEWILRGPVTASLTLGLVTLINRAEGVLGLKIDGLNTLATVVSIILLEYLVSWAMPHIERSSLVGLGQEDYTIFREFQGMMVFKPELETYLEALVGALCDRFQARDGFFAVSDESGAFDPVILTGESSWKDLDEKLRGFPAYVAENGEAPLWDEIGVMVPVFNRDDDAQVFLGVMGLADISREVLTDEDRQVIYDALDKARTVLWQRRYLTTAYQVLRSKSKPEESSFRSGSVLDRGALLSDDDGSELAEVCVWVKDALTHYWGGPRLSENPLMDWRIVKEAADGENLVSGLRAVLKNAHAELRPSGDWAPGGEWTLYNLIEMRFFEKMKVRDAAQKLSMSDADFYRKQKVAVEALTKVIIRMERGGNE